MGTDTTANPNEGAGSLSDLGDAFGAAEPNATTKPTPPRDASGRFQSQTPPQQQQETTGDTDDDTDQDGTGQQQTGQTETGDTDDDDEGGEQQQHARQSTDDDDEGEAEPLYELKANGKVHKLTRKQYEEAASKGLAATETWERASSTQKAAEALIERTNGERQQLGQLLGVVQQQLQALLQGDAQNLDQLAATNPAEYVRQKHLYDKRFQQLQQAQAAQAQLARQQQQQEQQRQGQFLELQKERVFDAIPAWRDPEKAKQGVARIHTLMADAGFTSAEIESVSDARIVRLLNAAAINASKARKYDELRSKAGTAAKKVANLPPAVVQPGARQQQTNARAEQRKKDVERWKKNPNLDNLARLF